MECWWSAFFSKKFISSFLLLGPLSILKVERFKWIFVRLRSDRSPFHTFWGDKYELQGYTKICVFKVYLFCFNLNGMHHPCNIILYIWRHNLFVENTWDHRSCNVFSIGPAIEHYQCFSLINKAINSSITSKTVEFLHYHLTQPLIIIEDRVTHAIQLLLCAIKYFPEIICNAQLQAIDNLCNIFEQWSSGLPQETAQPPSLNPDPSINPPSPPKPKAGPVSPLIVPTVHQTSPKPPANVSTPRVPATTSKGEKTQPISNRTYSRAASEPLHDSINQPLNAPVAHFTRSHTSHLVTTRKDASRIYPKSRIALLDILVLDG